MKLTMTKAEKEENKEVLNEDLEKMKVQLAILQEREMLKEVAYYRQLKLNLEQRKVELLELINQNLEKLEFSDEEEVEEEEEIEDEE
jgi:hypothetical protein